MGPEKRKQRILAVDLALKGLKGWVEAGLVELEDSRGRVQRGKVWRVWKIVSMWRSYVCMCSLQVRVQGIEIMREESWTGWLSGLYVLP